MTHAHEPESGNESTQNRRQGRATRRGTLKLAGQRRVKKPKSHVNARNDKKLHQSFGQSSHLRNCRKKKG